jgi:hypothetical protein
MGRCFLWTGGAVLLSILAFCSPAMAAETRLAGSSTVESQTDTESAGEAEAFSQTATASGTAETAYLYIAASNTAKTVVVGIYSNTGSHPGTLLSTGSAKATAAGTWASVPIAHVLLTSGTAYWLAIMGEGGSIHYRDHPGGTCKSETSSQAGMAALATTWKTGASYKDCPGSVYVTTGSSLPPPPPPAPVNTVLPAISGSAVEGQTLTGSTGTWSGAPTSYAYQWQDCNVLGEGCLGVSGATGLAYKLTASDVGGTIRLAVSATNEGGMGEAASSPTALVVVDPPPPPPPPPPVNTVLPAITGSAVEGQTLTGSTGTWSGAPTSYAYQWQDCNALGEGCVKAAGAMGSTFALTSANVGGTVRLSVTATNASGPTTATSASSAVVAAAPPPPPGEPALLMGVKVAHENGGDAKAEEVTPLKFTALQSGTVETLYFEAGGYKYAPSETSLILGIQESVGGKPGRVLGQGTITGTLGLNAIGKVGGLSVPVTSGTTYYLTFLPLGGSITYWFSKAETVIYSEHHKALEEGPPEKYVWKEEAQEAPIGMWAEGTTH